MSAQTNPADSYIEIEGGDDYNIREAKVDDFAELGLSDELLRGILG